MFCSYPVTDSLDHRARPPLPTPKRSFEHPTVGVMQQSSEPGLDGPFAAGTFTRASLAGRATRRCVRPPPLAWIPWGWCFPSARLVSFEKIPSQAHKRGLERNRRDQLSDAPPCGSATEWVPVDHCEYGRRRS